MSEAAFPTRSAQFDQDHGFPSTGEDPHIESSIEAGAPSPRRQPEAADALALVSELRAVRDSVFDGALFADPVWSILLELAVAQSGPQHLSEADLARAARISERTARRAISVLVFNGLVIGARGDVHERLYRLSPEGEAKMRHYAEGVSRAFGWR